MQPIVLILEDDQEFLKQHKEALEKAGFLCRDTPSVEQALDWINADDSQSIQFALIDVILHKVQDKDDVFETPFENGSFFNEPELQRLTGEGVVREISRRRRDVSYIFITSAPQKKSLESNNQLQTFQDEEARLLSYRGVVDVIHRYRMEGDNKAKMYRSIFNHITEKYTNPYRPVVDEIAIAQCSQAVGLLKVIPQYLQPSSTEQAVRYGTAWLISPDIIITSGHSLDNQKCMENSSLVDLPTTIQSSCVAFDYYQEQSKRIHYHFLELIVYNPILDFALIRLRNRSDYQLNQRSHIQLDLQHLITGDPDLRLIHHPRGKPQQLSTGWYVQPLHKATTRILYTVPGEEGTSGAPVIRTDTLRVIALHSAGFNELYKLQEGVRMYSIMEDLRERHPAIYDEIMHNQQR